MKLIAISFFTALLFVSCGGETEKSEEKEEEVKVEQKVTEQAATPSISKDISVDEFSTMIQENPGIIFDVRTPEEWAEGIVPGATKMNFFDENFKEQAMTLEKGKPIYVYCKAGGRSAKTMKLLSENGYTEVYNLLGGATALAESGFELVKPE